MQHYIVLFRRNDIQSALENPFGFSCFADDVVHAEEQCLNAEPNADIVWVWEGESHDGQYQTALADYFGSSFNS